MDGNLEIREAENRKNSALRSTKELDDSSTNDKVGSEIEKRLSLEDFIKKKNVTRYSKLYIALAQNDWKEAEDFIKKNPEALISIISELSGTFFHCIVESNEDGAIQLLDKYLKMVPPLVLEKENSYGDTALAKAAIFGNIKAAKLLVKKNRNLVPKNKESKFLLLHSAAISGHRETVKFLLSETKKSNEDLNLLAEESGYLLVDILMETNLYDIVYDLLKDDSKLGRDELSPRRRILKMLASKSMGFKSGSRLGYWEQLIYRCAWSQKLNIMLRKIILRRVRSIQAIHDKKLIHNYSVEIVKMMCLGVPWSAKEARESLKWPLFTATRLGILEIVQEIIKAYPDSLSFVDKDGNNVLNLAILHHQEKIFKLISQFGIMKQLKGNNRKNKDFNILHLAAKSVPVSEIPGAALQMQRELQWFKAVESYVEPTLQEERNKFGKTPREMFTEEHKELIEKGEKWMTKNASSCTIAISLIITAVFTAAFTVPGGNNDKGIPNFLKKLAFKIFLISDGLALFSSTTALLMFLGILTASYSEEDFLISLPRKLIIGFITMFVSIASMMVAFGATIYMVFPNPLKWVIIPLGCVPVTIFAKQQFPLLRQICYSTYAPTLS